MSNQRGCESGWGLEVGNGLDGMKSGEQKGLGLV